MGDDVLTLKTNNSQMLNLHVDVAHTVHVGMKSHTGSIFTMIKGSIASGLTK